MTQTAPGPTIIARRPLKLWTVTVGDGSQPVAFCVVAADREQAAVDLALSRTDLRPGPDWSILCEEVSEQTQPTVVAAVVVGG